ncbi:MAG: hypothetical protein CM15mP9_1050 [Methanobacteriota archaeon]|nr:MAG: hypothetical protein CM15mP9_1050 [Euryarchaeota archaeon]
MVPLSTLLVLWVGPLFWGGLIISRGHVGSGSLFPGSYGCLGFIQGRPFRLLSPRCIWLILKRNDKKTGLGEMLVLCTLWPWAGKVLIDFGWMKTLFFPWFFAEKKRVKKFPSKKGPRVLLLSPDPGLYHPNLLFSS